MRRPPPSVERARLRRLHDLIDKADKITFPSDTDDGDYVLTFRSPELVERFQSLDIPEIDLQRFVVECHAELGYSAAKGPFRRGPDVSLRRGRETIWAEVEVRPRDYLEHGHANDPAFTKVSLLIVPQQRPPSRQLREKLPPQIQYIKPDMFLPWWREFRQRDDSSRDKKRAAAKLLSLRPAYEDSAIHVLPCESCRHTSIFEVPTPRPGFRDVDDVADLACRCGAHLARVEALYSVRPVAVLDGLLAPLSLGGVSVEAVIAEAKASLRSATTKANRPRRRRVKR